MSLYIKEVVVRTLEGRVTAKVVGDHTKQLVEPERMIVRLSHDHLDPPLWVVGDQTPSTVTLADVSGVLGEGAQVDIRQLGAGTLPSFFAHLLNIFKG